MTSSIRRAGLTIHVIASAGWLGAVAAFLVLAVVGYATRDGQLGRGADVSMEVIARFVIQPLSLASLMTGLLQALATPWGLFRHYWVTIKFALTVLATIVLQIHMHPIGTLAAAAASAEWSPSAQDGLRFQVITYAAASLAVLLATTALAIIKPRGLTLYGYRRRSRERSDSATAPAAGPP